MPIATSGPRPRSELKLRSAALLAVLVSKNVAAVVETTLKKAYRRPFGEWSVSREICQMSLLQSRDSLATVPLNGIANESGRQQEICGSRRSEDTQG